jgi:hypothetical protein
MRPSDERREVASTARADAPVGDQSPPVDSCALRAVADTTGVPKLTTLTDQVRRAILEAPISRYELSKRLGVSQGTLGDFVHGRTGIGSELLDQVAAELGLRLIVGHPRKSKRTPR